MSSLLGAINRTLKQIALNTVPKPQIAQVKTIKYFQMDNGKIISPPQNKQWTLKSLVVEHANGTADMLEVFRNTPIGLFWKMFRVENPAADPANVNRISVTNGEYTFNSEWSIQFTGTLAWVSVLEEEIDRIFVQLQP